ncbi:MAG TPA: TonB-dependent receptor [Armatimonadota bacterium]
MRNRFIVALVCALALPLIAAAQVVQTGAISGTVTDASGQPISGVQIAITDSGLTAVSDARGHFLVTSLIPGPHALEATLVGYKPARLDAISVTQELTADVAVQLTERAVARAETTRVVVPIVKKGVTPTIYVVTSREEALVRNQPANLYQYIGAAISQPGIVPDADGNPTIRGSRRAETGYLLDGILLTMPGSGEFATNLVTVGLDRMNVYTGGLRAEQGGATGGLINAVVKTGASIRGAAVEAAAGNWGYTGLVYEQGNVEKSGLNWYVSGIAFRTDFEKNPAWSGSPGTGDAIAKILMPIGRNDRLTLLATLGSSRQNVPETDPTTGVAWGADPRNPSAGGQYARHGLEYNDSANAFERVAEQGDYLTQQHSIGSLTWAHSFNAASALSAQAYGWSRRKDVNAESAFDGWWDSHTDDSVAAAKVDYSAQPMSWLTMRAGAERISGWNDDRLAKYGEPGSARGAYLRYRNAGTTDFNGFVSFTAKPGARLTADLGLRYDSREYERRITDAEIALGRTSADPTKDIRGADEAVLARTGRHPKYDAVSPRLGLSYSLNDQTVLKASAGRAVQFAPSSYIENVYRPQGDVDGGGAASYYPSTQRKVFDVGPEKVDSIDMGVERAVGQGASLAVTPYWRRIRDMIDRGPALDAEGNPSAGLAYSNLAHGHTRGVESKLTFRERKGLSGWLSYTYQVAKANAIAPAIGQGSADLARPDDEFRVSFDQRHTIYVVGKYLKGRFEVNPMLELGSGYPWGGQAGDGESGSQYGVDPTDPTREIPILVDGKLQSTNINPYNTGWHKNLSVTFRIYTDQARKGYWFLQVSNLLNSGDVTARYFQNPYTGSNWLGYVPGPVTYVDENGATQTADGHLEYKPWTRVPPVFVLAGVRRSF